MTGIAENIFALTQKIRALEENYGRGQGVVKVLAVSKRHGVEMIREAAAAGLVDFGENYLQEALHKIGQLQDLDLCWHFIGPIQANKTRGIAENFHWVHSVDRERIAQRLSEQRTGAPLNICVQVNLSAEDSKSGVALDAAETLCETIAQLDGLTLRGLMAIPAPLPDLDSQRRCFRELAQEFTRLRQRFPTMDTLSMGMSNDFEAAIAEGSTLIRIGTAIFGPRG